MDASLTGQSRTEVTLAYSATYWLSFQVYPTLKVIVLVDKVTTLSIINALMFVGMVS